MARLSFEQLFEQSLDVAPADEQIDLASLPGRGGVYALVDAEATLIQLAGTESLRRAVSFRLTGPQAQPTRRRADLRAITHRIWWQRTFSQFETTFQFYRIARQLAPADYLDMCAFGPAWFAHVNPDERFARFVPTTDVFAEAGTDVGPFASRASCTRFIEILQDVFELCRYHSILVQAPHGTPCAYFEMGRCPAPCSGRIPLERYREMVLEAVRFACTGRRHHVDDLAQQMQAASKELQFEQAAKLKQTIERAKKALAKPYEFVDDARRFNYLIVQRGGGRTRVKPFFVRQGLIEPGQTVLLRELDQAAPCWLERMSQQPTPTGPDEQESRTEQVWLVAHYLFKQDKVPGLYVAAGRLGDPDELSALVRNRFAVAARQPDPSNPANHPEHPIEEAG